MWQWCIFKEENCSLWPTLLSNSVSFSFCFSLFIRSFLCVHAHLVICSVWPCGNLKPVYSRLVPPQSYWQWFSCVHYCVVERHIPVRLARPPLSVDICLVLVAAVSRLRVPMIEGKSITVARRSVFWRQQWCLWPHCFVQSPATFPHRVPKPLCDRGTCQILKILAW